MIIINIFVFPVWQSEEKELEVVDDELPIVQHETSDKSGVVVECPDCNWTGKYDNDRKAKQGLGRHSGWCKKRVKHKSGFSRPFKK